MNYHIGDIERLSNTPQLRGDLKQKLIPVKCGDQIWRHYTELANHAFKCQDKPAAKHYYLLALNEVEILFQAALVCECSYSAPIVYNISCHNCAAFVALGGDHDIACEYFYKAYNRLLATANAVDSLPTMRLACAQHLKIALIALVDHLAGSQNNEQEIVKLKQQAAQAALKVYHMREHIT